jgi:competence protein ComEC
MLIYRPLDLYNAGFQLSFGTVLGMILLTPSVLRAMQRWRSGDDDEDARVARLLSPPSRWTLAADHVDGLLVKAVAAGFVAWLVSMPLIAIHFEQLNPWAIPASLIMAVPVLFALIFGFLKVLLTLLWPGAAALWVTLTAWPVGWMRAWVEWLASWPRSDVPLPPPPGLLVIAYYALLLTMVLPLKRDSIIWGLRIARAGMLLVLLWLPYETDAAHRRTARDSLRVTLLAVGAGQCVVVEPPSGRVVLVDAGSSSLTDLVSKCLGPYLRHRGCTSVDTIILTHADYDHYSAAAEVAGAYQVREVLTGAHFARHATQAPLATRMLRTFDALQRPPRVLEPGQRMPLGRDTALEVLWPPRDRGDDFESNDVSLVLRLTHAGRSILLSGDIEDVAMRELLAGDATKLKSDVLVAPHHGSSESLTQTFVAAVDPGAIVSSNDRTLSRRQVDFEGMIAKRPLLRTHTSGAITIEIDGEGRVTVTPFLSAEKSLTLAPPAASPAHTPGQSGTPRRPGSD